MEKSIETIAFLGLGAMGSRMAMNLVQKGYKVMVWNRTPEAARALVDAGAIQAKTPHEAALEADCVISMVRDDQASEAVWLDPHDGALAAMKADAIAIESSTVTKSWIERLYIVAFDKKVALLEAPVSGSLPQAESGQLVYFVGGEEAVYNRVLSVLQVMGSTVQYLGKLGAATLTKLTTNAMLGIQVTAYAELIGMLQQHGANVSGILEAISKTSVWSPVANYLTNSMTTGDFEAKFPVELIRKDFLYLMELVPSKTDVPVSNVAKQVFEKAIENKLGQHNMTSVVQLYSEK